MKLVFMHSLVYARMQKNNEIEHWCQDGRVFRLTQEGKAVIVDDGLPKEGVFEMDTPEAKDSAMRSLHKRTLWDMRELIANPSSR